MTNLPEAQLWTVDNVNTFFTFRKEMFFDNLKNQPELPQVRINRSAQGSRLLRAPHNAPAPLSFTSISWFRDDRKKKTC